MREETGVAVGRDAAAHGRTVAGGSAAVHEPQRAGVPTRHRHWRVPYALLVLIWGSSFLLMMLGLRAFAPLQISGLRIMLGAAAVTVAALATRTRLPRDIGTWAHLQVSGLFLATIPYSLFAFSEQRITSALAGVANALTPVATVILAVLFLRGVEQVTLRKVAGIALGLTGVLVLLQPWGSAGRSDPLGLLMAMAAATCYGIGWVYNRRFLGGRDLGGLAQPTAQILVAAGQMVVVILVWWLGWGNGHATPLSPLDGRGWVLPLLAVLALGVLGTGLAFVLQFEVVRAAGPTVLTTTTFPITVVSALLGVLLLGERMGAVEILGAAIIVAAALLIQWPARKRRSEGAPADVEEG